jgi:hypothetical protein
MAIKASFSPGAGLLSVFGDALDDQITLSRDAAGRILINGGAIPVLGGQPTVANTALMQVLAYLVLENGIFIMGLTLLEAMPFLVELGVLLDLFVGIFVMGIIINHISREFSSLDTDRLSALKE